MSQADKLKVIVASITVYIVYTVQDTGNEQSSDQAKFPGAGNKLGSSKCGYSRSGFLFECQHNHSLVPGDEANTIIAYFVKSGQLTGYQYFYFIYMCCLCVSAMTCFHSENVFGTC